MYSCLWCSTTMLCEDTGKRFCNVSNLFFAFSTFLLENFRAINGFSSLWNWGTAYSDACNLTGVCTTIYILSLHIRWSLTKSWQLYSYDSAFIFSFVSCLVGKSYIDKRYTFSRMQIDHWIAIVGRDLEIIDTTFPANAGTYNRFTDRHPERFGISL